MSSISRRAIGSEAFRGLRGRFLLGALLLLIVLLSSGILAEYHLDRQQQRRAEHLQQRQTALAASRILRNAFWDASHFLQLFSLNPRPQYERKALQALHRGQREARRLAETPWVQRHDQVHLARRLRREFGQLAQEARGLFATRTDPERLHPSLGVMRQRLAPASTSFLNAAQLATRSPGASPGKAQDLFRQVRYLWSRLVGEFRLYMTARVGLLGNAGDGSRIRNLESFSTEVSSALTELTRLREQGALNLAQSRALTHLKEDRRQWLQGYREVRRLHANFSWRTDFPLIRNTLHPLYEAIQGILLRLDKRIEASAARDAEAMTAVAERIATIIWTLLLVHLVAVIVGYLFLGRGILSPLARLSGALRKEAQGLSFAGSIPDGPREIREVASAFHVLRQEVRSREAALEHQACHDPLTGLPNRTLLEDRLGRALDQVRHTDGTGAVLMLDLDFFKEINDAFGHPVGDEVLVEVAARLTDQVQESDTVARFGGDEFGVLLPDTAPEPAAQVASGILKALHEKLEVGGRELHVGASIGLARFPEHGEDAETLVRVADLAMYEAKRTRQGVVVFHPHQHKDVTERLTRINELFEDIHRGHIPLHFQPKVDTQTGRLVGAEALLRWGPSGESPQPPAEVFAMAERAGVSRELTQRILNAAIRECASWRARGWDLAVAVNLSVNDLQTPELEDRIREVLSAWDVPARRLELEITENAMMADPGDAHRILAELRALGIRIAVDDYGTGYSSLSYLKELPVDVLKIDKSFVTELAQDPHNQAIVRSTVDLGHSLGLEVVAEGVENEEALALLTRWHCERAQGFHLGHPQPAEAFLRPAEPVSRPA